MRIVVDTNVLLNAIFPNSSNYWLYERIIDGRFELCVSTEILAEYAEIFGRYFGDAITENFLYSLLYSPSIVRTEIYYKWQLVKADQDDDKFVDCAIASNAKCIVTHDKHFEIVGKNKFPKLTILKPEELKMIFST
jgi:putative PIN family toxin of toxin-antitoxin system